ncbi:MAG: hypothetical protein RJA10_3662 [Pseudomonadota bacterium]|jgi:hypothetical protein
MAAALGRLATETAHAVTVQGRPWAAWRAGLLLCLWPLALGPAQGAGDTQLAPGPTTAHWPRLGLNLGHRTAWGAEQLMANVLRNPGLEAGLDGALVVVGQVAGGLVSDNAAALNRADGFWVGARFTVLTGADAGAQGTVRDSHPAPGTPAGPSRFLLDPHPARLIVGDVIAVQGQQAAEPAPLWWTQGRVRALVGQGRPGSPGRQSVRLDASSVTEAALFNHLDSITARAGKLLKVQGPWLFSIWARKTSPQARVQVRFRRHGHAAWLDHSWEPGSQWSELRLPFEPRDSGPDGPLELSITVRGGSVDLDDVYLGEASAGEGGFRNATVEALKLLRPGYLREWQGQLGDSAGNRLAPPLQRQPTRYRPGAQDWFFHYGLSEFAELAAAVGARPWFVLPAVGSPAQAQAVGTALRDIWRKHRFDEVLVEYGNEHWNPMFRAAGITDHTRLARAGALLFDALKKAAGPEVPLHLVLGAQFVRPDAATALHAPGVPVDSVAVAPYFSYRMSRGQTVADMARDALAETDAHFATWRRQLPRHVDLSVYEVHAHTTAGDAPEGLRAQWAESGGLAVALGRRLLQAAQHGVRRQAVYKLSGFDTPVDPPASGLVPLFGITRALGPPVQWRPGGQVLAALNALDWTRTSEATCSGPGCDKTLARYFGAGSQLALVSSSDTAVPMSWACPAHLPASWRLRWIGAEVPGTAAASWQESHLPCQAGVARWVAPPRSLAVAEAH